MDDIELVLILRFGSIEVAFREWMLNTEATFNEEENKFMRYSALELYPNLRLNHHRSG